MDLHRSEEIGFAPVLEHAGTLEPEVGGVELKNEAVRGDHVVLFLQLASEREHIGLVCVVIGILHRGRDDAGRGRGHEGVGRAGFGPGKRVSEHPAFRLRRGEVDVADLTDRARRVVDAVAAADARRPHLRVEWKFIEIAGRRPPRFAAEALHAHGHVHGEPDPRLFAVADDVDTGGKLRGDHGGNRARALAVKLRLVDALAGLVPQQQVGEVRGAREAAAMGGENAIGARAHRELSLAGIRAGWRSTPA